MYFFCDFGVDECALASEGLEFCEQSFPQLYKFLLLDDYELGSSDLLLVL